MKPRHKTYLKINIISLVFIGVSFMSVTLAWFAYSGLAHVNTEIGVKAWYIELDKDGEKVSNDIVISLSEIYPGMNTVNEIINIKNKGDSDAQIKYSIVSARILGEEKDNYIVDNETTSTSYVEDVLSHDYPFHVNINLSKSYAVSKAGESSFAVSVSWPLDSDSDQLDSLWGTKAYEFQHSEEEKKSKNPNYQVRPAIQIVISVTAEQYIKENTASDMRYNFGDTVLFDVVNNHICGAISPTCLKTYIIDTNNKVGDNKVTLLPDPNSIYLSSTFDNYSNTFSNITNDWAVETRPLLVQDILNVISTDVIKSYLVRDGISDSIIGDLSYNNRMTTEINKATTYNGYYKFYNDKYKLLNANNCYWTNSNYNNNNGFAVKPIDVSNSKLYGENKMTECNVVPLIIANKADL